MLSSALKTMFKESKKRNFALSVKW